MDGKTAGDVGVGQPVQGRVTHVGLSGIGPNSGELTLNIEGDAGELCQVFAGIMPDRRHPDALEQGVFAAFVSLALAAYATKAHVVGEYRMTDKKRIYKLALQTK